MRESLYDMGKTCSPRRTLDKENPHQGEPTSKGIHLFIDVPLLDEIEVYSGYDDTFIYKITFTLEKDDPSHGAQQIFAIHVGNIFLDYDDIAKIENYHLVQDQKVNLKFPFEISSADVDVVQGQKKLYDIKINDKDLCMWQRECAKHKFEKKDECWVCVVGEVDDTLHLTEVNNILHLIEYFDLIIITKVNLETMDIDAMLQGAAEREPES